MATDESVVEAAPEFDVVTGGAPALTAEQRGAVSVFAHLLRGMPPGQAQQCSELLIEFSKDGYLDRLQSHEVPVLKILAEVINGWEPDGVHEFARAWTSTLVARTDGFHWERATSLEKAEHQERVEEELCRRGIGAEELFDL